MTPPQVRRRAHAGGAARRRDRHRPRADAHRAAAKARRGGQVHRVLRSRAGVADGGRPGDALEHVARVRGDGGHVPGRRPDAALPAPTPAARPSRSSSSSATRASRGSSAPAPRPAPAYSETLDLDLDAVVPSLAGPRRPQDRVSLPRRGAIVLGRVRGRHAERQPPRRRVGRDLGDHVVHEHVQPGADGRRRAWSPRRRSSSACGRRPWVKTSLAPGIAGRGRLPRAGRPDGAPRRSSGSTWSASAARPASATPGRCPTRSRARSSATTSRWRPCSRATATSRPASTRRCAPTTWPRRRSSWPTRWPGASTPISRPSRSARARDGPVYLRDVWPSADEVDAALAGSFSSDLFTDEYGRIFDGDERWRRCPCPRASCSPGIRARPTCARRPSSSTTPTCRTSSTPACSCVLGDSVTTDHISPAGAFSPDTPAGKYLVSQGVAAARLQLLRRPPRQPRGDGAGHVREHPAAQRARRPRGRLHPPPAVAASR